MKYRHVVFDIDGTITDTEASLVKSLQDVCQELLGHRPSPSELRFSFGIPSSDTYKQLDIKDTERADDIWSERFDAYSDSVSLFPGIEDALHALHKRGHILGIITSKSHREFMESFPQYGLGELFSLVVCADDTEQHKPHPEPMQLYLRQMNAKPEDVLYVGDTIYDMHCTHGAGCAGALATWGNRDHASVAAEFYPTSPAKLVEIAEGLVIPQPLKGPK